ncbi:MAG: type II toxin-antitoxin system VapB family antitoxin [Hyphomicrobiales bacterium]
MPKSTVFRFKGSQAVRLPKAVALPEHVKRLDIFNQGSRRLIVPAGESWASFFDCSRLDTDFLSDRAQPAPQGRPNARVG